VKYEAASRRTTRKPLPQLPHDRGAPGASGRSCCDEFRSMIAVIMTMKKRLRWVYDPMRTDVMAIDP
jgi:hypothetical protein